MSQPQPAVVPGPAPPAKPKKPKAAKPASKAEKTGKSDKSQLDASAASIAQKKSSSEKKHSSSSGSSSDSDSDSEHRPPRIRSALSQLSADGISNSSSSSSSSIPKSPRSPSQAVGDDIHGLSAEHAHSIKQVFGSEPSFLSSLDQLIDEPPSSSTTSSSSSSSSSTSASNKSSSLLDLVSDSDTDSTYHRRSNISILTHDLQEPTEVFCMSYSPDSRFLAAGCGEGSIRIFNSSGKMAYIMRGPTMDGLPTTCIRFRPPGASANTKNVLISANADGTLTHWHMMSQTCLYSIKEEDNQIYAVDYSPDGEQFVTAGRDTYVRLYEDSTKTLICTMHSGGSKGSIGHSNRVYSVKFHPSEPNIVVSGGWDNTIQIWDTRMGVSVRNIYGPHICGDALDFDPTDANVLLAASWRPHDNLQRYDFGKGVLIDTVAFASNSYDRANSAQGRADLLYAAQYHPTGEWFAAGGVGNNEARLFHSKTGKSIERITSGGGVYALSFAPSGKKLAIAGADTTITVLDLE